MRCPFAVLVRLCDSIIQRWQLRSRGISLKRPFLIRMFLKPSNLVSETPMETNVERAWKRLCCGKLPVYTGCKILKQSIQQGKEKKMSCWPIPKKGHKEISFFLFFGLIEISSTVAQGIFPLQQPCIFLSGMCNEVVVWWRLGWEIKKKKKEMWEKTGRWSKSNPESDISRDGGRKNGLDPKEIEKKKKKLKSISSHNAGGVLNISDEGWGWRCEWRSSRSHSHSGC